MLGLPIFLIVLWTAVSAFFWMYHRFQELATITDVSSLPKWVRIVTQELEREFPRFHRGPSKIWRMSLGVLFAAMLVFYFAIDYTVPLTIRLGIGLLCTLALVTWAYYLDRLLIRVRR